MSLESIPAAREQNHFNLLRLIAACSVIVSHSFWVAGGPDVPDPLQARLGFDLGTTAVLAFFAISGFFISLSFDRQPSALAFMVARARRIVPALIAVSLITAFIVGPMFTGLAPAAYFKSRSVWLYPLQTSSVVRIMAARLPDLFPDNPCPNLVNVPLWTLFYEVSCYAGLLLAGVAGLLRSRRFPILILVWVPSYGLARYGPWPKLELFAFFSLPFIVGMAVYQYRSAGLLRGWVALALAMLAVGLSLSGIRIEELWSLATAFGILWLGFARAPSLLAFNRIGDFSYGTYIYGFLLQQMSAALIPGIEAGLMILICVPAAIACGAASWHLVERPSLRRRIGRQTDA